MLHQGITTVKSGTFTHARLALLSLVLVASVLGLARASEAFLTIQAGTYSPSALHFARKHYRTLAETLGADASQHLRILQGSKYYIVRMGNFQSYAEALEVLKKVRSVSADAFILDEEPSEAMHILEMYASQDTAQKGESAGAGVIRLDGPAPLASGEKNTVTAREGDHEESPAAPEEYYTLQAGNFLKLEQAREEMDRLTRILQGDDIKDLRIESAGASFSVRLGRFATYAEARALRQRHQDVLPGANILRSSSGSAEERPGSTPSPDVRAANRVGEATGGDRAVETLGEVDAERQKLEIAEFFREVSSQYYDQQYGKAAELLRKGIAKWPDNPDLHAWYGATLLNMRFSENALEQYRKAIELSPDVSDFHAGAGHSLLAIYMARARESIDAFKKALEIDPDNVSALEGLGFAYASIGKKDEAMGVQSRLQKLDRNAAERLSRAIAAGVDWGQ